MVEVFVFFCFLQYAYFDFFFFNHLIIARDLSHVVLIFNKRCSCMNKGWSWNNQCKVTQDNNACISLKTQLKHMCICLNAVSLFVYVLTKELTQWNTLFQYRHWLLFLTNSIVSHLVHAVISNTMQNTIHYLD